MQLVLVINLWTGLGVQLNKHCRDLVKLLVKVEVSCSEITMLMLELLQVLKVVNARLRRRAEGSFRIEISMMTIRPVLVYFTLSACMNAACDFEFILCVPARPSRISRLAGSVFIAAS